jgi:hypothetical protein
MDLSSSNLSRSHTWQLLHSPGTKSLLMRRFLILLCCFNICCFTNISFSQISFYSANSSYKYVAVTDTVAENWKLRGYNDSEWSKGAGALGFGYPEAVKTEINPTTSVFVRHAFMGNSKIDHLFLHIDFDDGFVAWLNGHEIVRENMGKSGSEVKWNDTAQFSHQHIEDQRRVAYYIDEQTFKSHISKGLNILAVQIHNDRNDGSDLYYWSELLSSGSVSGMIDWFYRQKVELDSSYLPILVVKTDEFGIPDEPKTRAKLGVINNGAGNIHTPHQPFNEYDGNIGIETRGASSQWWYPKKSYGIKLLNENYENLSISLLGMPADEDWVLYGPYDDKSMIRNRFVYQLGESLGYYAPRTRFCELIINDAYLGIYLLTEKIKRDKNRVNISKLNSTDNSGDAITGGYIIKIDKQEGENTGGWDSEVIVNKQSVHYEFHYPNVKKITYLQAKYIRDFMHEFESALISENFMDPQSGYKRFINDTSFMDYIIVNELSRNMDAYRFSTFMHKDKDSKDNRLHMGPLWDYNFALGNDDYMAITEGWRFGSHPFWWRRMMEDTVFVRELIDRWQFLRTNKLHINTIHNLVDSCVASLHGMEQHNFDVWPMFHFTQLWPRPWLYSGQSKTYSEEIEFLKRWLSDRLEWMDMNITKIYYPIESFLPTDVTEVADAFYYSVYPNPFSDELNIEVGGIPDEPILLIISDLSGRIIRIDDFLPESKQLLKLNLSAAKEGVYLYTLIKRGKVLKSGKIIKTG